LVDPVTLPCGHTVCKRHADEQLEGPNKPKKIKFDELMEASPKESNTFLCTLCDDEHYIPKKGFAINKRFQNALDIKLNTLKLNPVYEECKKEIDDAKNNIQKIENLNKDPENCIYEFFEELKREVDLRREKLKLELDNSSDEILQFIESAKDNCIKLSKETKKLSTEIEKSKEELTELVGRFDTFEIDYEKFEEIRESLTVLNEDLTRKLEEFKDSIIGDKNYILEFQEIDIKSLFGSFKEVEKVISNELRYM